MSVTVTPSIYTLVYDERLDPGATLSRVGHREELLAAARRLLESQGYARITARDLVAESGTNLASIGYHFGSKEGLLNEAIGTAIDEWTERLAAVAMADPNAAPLQRAQATWSALLANLPKHRALLLSFVEAMAQAERTPALREQFAALYRGMRSRVAELVVRSLGGTALDGALAADDPRALAIASWVIAVCDGLALQWLLDPEGAPSASDLNAGHALMWRESLRVVRAAQPN
jgi:AcrR family transcriptional regulator